MNNLSTSQTSCQGNTPMSDSQKNTSMCSSPMQPGNSSARSTPTVNNGTNIIALAGGIDVFEPVERNNAPLLVPSPFHEPYVEDMFSNEALRGDAYRREQNIIHRDIGIIERNEKKPSPELVASIKAASAFNHPPTETPPLGMLRTSPNVATPTLNVPGNYQQMNTVAINDSLSTSNFNGSNIFSSSDPSAMAKRVVLRSNTKMGFSASLKRDRRLIVFEENDQNLVREYTYSGNKSDWYCRHCEAKNGKRNNATLNEETVDVPIKHSCEPITYEQSKRDQENFLNRYNNALKHGQKRSAKQRQNAGANNDGYKRSRLDESGDHGGESFNNTTVESSNNTTQNGNNAWNDFDDPQPPTPPIDSCKKPAAVSNSPNSTELVSSDSGFHVPAEANLPTPHEFIHPSSAFPKRCCKKLNLEYCHAAYVFWSTIGIREFSHNSIPSTTLPINDAENSGFAAVSLYLTGSENSGIKIKEALQNYFFYNADAVGECLGMDLTRITDPFVRNILQSFTYVHFVVMAQMFECRFAVYENGKWMRYGSWTDAYLPLIILENKKDKYSPVLSFKN